MNAVRTELRGQGWAFSVQRWRIAPVPHLSSNLGAAAIALIGRHGHLYRVAFRVEEEEQFWVSVVTQHGAEVSGALPDGRVLLDERLANPDAHTEMHRLARIAGEDRDGIGPEHIRIFQTVDGTDDSLSITIGARLLHLRAIESHVFDTRFGSLEAVSGEPAVYAGWRLP
jgi:hypothetical protein